MLKVRSAMTRGSMAGALLQHQRCSQVLLRRGSERAGTIELPPADERRRGGRRQDALVRDDDTLEAIAGRQLQDDLSKRRTKSCTVRLRMSSLVAVLGQRAVGRHELSLFCVRLAPISQSHSRSFNNRCTVKV